MMLIYLRTSLVFTQYSLFRTPYYARPQIFLSGFCRILEIGLCMHEMELVMFIDIYTDISAHEQTA